MVINFAQSRMQSRVSFDYSCTISKIQNTGHSQHIRPWEIVEHGFVKKCDSHKLCAKLSFNRFFVYHLRNTKFKPIPTYLPIGSYTSLVSRKNAMVINFVQSRAQSQVSIGLSSSVSEIQNTGHSQLHGKSYEHSFAKKCDGHKLFTKSSFDCFFLLRLEN
ncbi:hypothetical protein BHE74_00025594 [Ensete ventricosum]|nr:hypothetical protein BHE74_00025594 [Ensete ventricosum]RZR82668.1 hypothetical protein BHM03_00009132 [Ensete ventricosum]